MKAAKDTTKPSPPKAGIHLLHPLVVASIALLLLNDHVLKWHYPGWITGKLSDVAGLLFFSLLLRAGWEVMQAMVGCFQGHSNRVLFVCTVLTGAVFSVTQVTWWGAHAYRWGLGALQALATGQWGRVFSPVLVRHTADPWDLLALPVLGVAVWVGWGE